MINARAETIAEKNAYKHAFKKRRCIIPADGFYEWKKVPGQKAKQPYFIQRADGEPLAFAGLWEVWRPKKAEGDEADARATASSSEAARSSPASPTRRWPRSTTGCR